MRKSGVATVLGYIILLFSFAFIIPLLTGIIYGEEGGFLMRAYILPMIISAGLGLAMLYYTKEYEEDLREREAFVVVGLGWLLIAALGALPYLFGGSIPGVVDAYFESMSGFTTTSATILNPMVDDYINIYPHSILMWRAVTTWLGGMGIIVFSVVILARYLEGGVHLFKAEVAGASVTRLRPRLHQTARILWGVYGLFTLLSIILLMGAGLGPFDSVTTSFSSLSTGGFSVHSDNIGFYDSPGVEMVIMVFMIIGASNFVLHYRIMTGKYREALEDPELRTFLTWLALVSIISISALVISGHYGLGESVRKGLFQCVSAATTTGFSTANDIALWPPVVHILLIILMLVGATLGSTGGGLKVSRIYILVKNVKNGILKAIHPRVVQQVKVHGRIIPGNVVTRIQILLFSYILILCLSIIALCASGIGVEESLSAVASCLSNSGLGIFGPGEGFHTLNSFAKVVLTFDMWIGRLEIITGLIILSPSTYRT